MVCDSVAGAKVPSWSRRMCSFAQNAQQRRLHAPIGAFGIGEQSIVQSKANEIVLRHGADLVQLAHDEIPKRQLRRVCGRPHRQHIRHAPMLCLHELDHRSKLGLQVRHASLTLGLQLLDHFLELSISSADLVLDQSCPLLQISPDVAHGPVPAFVPHEISAKPWLAREPQCGQRIAQTEGLGASSCAS
jgi:hypothetical protein